MKQGQRILAMRVALVVVVLAVVGGPGTAGGATPTARAEARRGRGRAEHKELSTGGPQILFEQVVCDLGEVGVGT